MLGSWCRTPICFWHAADRDAIGAPRRYLGTVVTRLCLDRMKLVLMLVLERLSPLERRPILRIDVLDSVAWPISSVSVSAVIWSSCTEP